MVATTLHFPDTWVQINGIISMIIVFKSQKCQGNPKETTDRPTFFSTKEQVQFYFIFYYTSRTINHEPLLWTEGLTLRTVAKKLTIL